jgi:uncharacterized protein (TIGR02246 family)
MDGEMTRGRDAIARRYESLLTSEFARSELTIELRSLRLLKPDVALVDGELQLTRTGQTTAERPQFMAIMVSDGTHWQITSLWMQSRSARK